MASGTHDHGRNKVRATHATGKAGGTLEPLDCLDFAKVALVAGAHCDPCDPVVPMVATVALRPFATVATYREERIVDDVKGRLRAQGKVLPAWGGHPLRRDTKAERSTARPLRGALRVTERQRIG